MSEDYDLIFNKVNSSNISAIGERQSELEERRIIELYEAVSEICETLSALYGEMEICDALTLLSESFVFPSSSVHRDAIEPNISRIAHYLSFVSAFDKAVFADLLIARFEKKGYKITERDFLSENHYKETFVYFKNALSDEAYDVFSENFTDPRLKYAKSLREAAVLTADGEVTYALLPLEESGGQRLHTASELIYKYDLKINAITPVFGMDGCADMKYALVSRGFSIPSMEKDDDLYLEIRVSRDSVSLDEMLIACRYYGCEVYRINSVTFNTDGEDDDFYSIVFKSMTGSFKGLIAYLTLFIKSYVPVGIYKNLE